MTRSDMTVNINSKEKFRGIGLLDLRALLRAWEKERSPIRLRYLKNLPNDAGDVMSLLQDALEASLIGMTVDDESHSTEKIFTLTGAGKAVAFADASKRVSKDAALKVLSSVVEASENLSKDENAPIKVAKIWVFGSVINPDKNDVGDLDIAIETVRTNKWKSSVREMERYVEKIYPGLLPESCDIWHVDSEFVKKSLYGPRRNRLISETDVGTLIQLHVPCALVYDQKMGRIEQPKVLNFHPESKGRSSNIVPRRVMPNLPPFSASEFAPTDAVLLALAERYNRGDAPVHLETGLQLDRKRLTADSPELDGSSAFAITFKDHLGRERPYFCVVRRSLTEGVNLFEYRCDVEMKRVGKAKLNLQDDEQEEVARVLSLICGADSSRLARRHNELNLTKPVRFIATDVGRHIPLWNTVNLAQESANRFKERVRPGLIRQPGPPPRPVPGPPRASQVNGLLFGRIGDRKGPSAATSDAPQEFFPASCRTI